MTPLVRFRSVANAAMLVWATTAAGCSDAQQRTTSPPPPHPVSGEPAFPGAVGYGAASAGGRGGRVIAVDTLADSGPGTFRTCVEAEGPRTCVFRVAGVIRFAGRSPVIRNPYLTIAGQTAPGGGITLAHSGGEEARTPLIVKNSHDIVIRHIRVRNDRIGGSRGSEDSITIENSDNVVIDHVSASWARDELINGYGDNDRITISNSILAQGLPRHDKCALLASDPKGPQRLSFIGNLCAHNGDRNPDLNFPPGSCAEVVNNLFYNAQSEFTEVWESFGGAPVSLIGNSYVAGRNTHPRTVGIARNLIGSKGQAKIYMWDNRFVGDFVHVSPQAQAAAVPKPPCPPTVAAMPANAAYERTLSVAGAFPRDAFDAAVVDQVRRRGGHIVKHPGDIPSAAPGTPYPDTDSDGMDDRWEARHGADPRRFDAWTRRGGIANLDRFLDMRAHQIVAPRSAR